MTLVATRSCPTLSRPSKARTATGPVPELFLYRTHTAAVGHARHVTTAPSAPLSIVDTHNDDVFACGSIVEEFRPHNPRRCSHRVFSVDVKTAAIARVLDDNRHVREVAAEFEVSYASLQRWVAQAQALPSRTVDAAEPSAWVLLPHPLDCTDLGDPEPSGPPSMDPPTPNQPPSIDPPTPNQPPSIDPPTPSDPPSINPPAPPEEAPSPPAQAPPPQEFPPASEPDMEPPSPPEQAPPPQEIPPASYA